ncbi:MAG: methylated-DNA--[protein]-cysteine S-methyltransferase [Rhodobacteraceae bacterium]|nr:MAG: methylated-DNA--[protein]-cysteine S-methyltransferase [Paracoccaceae bacterium]
MDEHATEHRYHYRVMERAIALIDAPGGRQCSLDELAAALGMSGAHFQRIFSQWVGVSPKRYQQYLTLDHARTLLRERFSTLETAHEAGLSGQARLHDLFLRWEAMTPGEYARRGDGLVLRYGWFDTPFGTALGIASARGLTGLAFAEDDGREACLSDMARRWPQAELRADPSAAAPHVAAAFARKGRAQLHLIGTPFQIKVWEALLHVPSGHVTSYGAIGARVRAPKAARAVGAAVGRNPIGFLIPCHRCLRGAGGLGGYHWGLARKRAMLAWEAARHDGAAEAPALAPHSVSEVQRNVK